MMIQPEHLECEYADRAGVLDACLEIPLDQWLSRRECRRLGFFGNVRRRHDWLAGRWLGKRLVLNQLDKSAVALRDIDISSRDQWNRSVRPQVLVHRRRVPWSLSLSHNDLGVMAALNVCPDIHVGIDVVPVESYSFGLLRTWFTTDEQQRLHDASDRSVAVTWATKEAVYKAVNVGESFMPRRFEITVSDEGDVECRHNGHPLPNSCGLRAWDIHGQVASLCVARHPSATKSSRYPLPPSHSNEVE